MPGRRDEAPRSKDPVAFFGTPKNASAGAATQQLLGCFKPRMSVTLAHSSASGRETLGGPSQWRDGPGVTPPALAIGQRRRPQVAGGMFWLKRNWLSGSYLFLI